MLEFIQETHNTLGRTHLRKQVVNMKSHGIVGGFFCHKKVTLGYLLFFIQSEFFGGYSL